jgi:ubiquinone/menaquinone biosynthesis C-methylase UbiE
MGQYFKIAMDCDYEQYDHWYKTNRGHWIGQCELELLFKALNPKRGDSLLDVGCGTGFFTREMSGGIGGKAVGIDINQKWIRYAYRQDSGISSYAVADAGTLPFSNAAFDIVISVTALCFIPDMHVAIREMIRVSRRSLAIGLLNRHSLLWLQKGRNGERGAYRGAHWYTVNEVKSIFSKHPIKNLVVQTAVHIPSGGKIAQYLEHYFPHTLSTGAFILVSGEIVR